MKIAIKQEQDEYVIDLKRRTDGYEKGDLICYSTPWLELPLRLEIAIRTNGDLAFRGWDWNGNKNSYLHTDEVSKDAPILEKEKWREPFIPTPEQIDTVSGLFSGRMKFEGLKLHPGNSLQNICPIDVEKEEKRTKGKIYLR
jgi:hypothetical protein